MAKSAHAVVPLDPAAATAVRLKPSLDFSLTGLVYCSMMMFMGLAAINSQANLLFGVFGLMIGILLISGVISRLVLRGLRVSRELPDGAVVGQPCSVTYTFANGKSYWPSLSVGFAELEGVEAFTRQPNAYLLHAAGGTSANVPAEIIPKRRGLHQLGKYQLSTAFPFGFVKRAVERRKPDSFVVFPPLARVDRRLLQRARSAERSGATMRPRRGGQDEFYGLKEYRVGESPRRIYWRRSAHVGSLVVKEMTQVAPPRLVLLVDTHLRDRSTGEHVRVEQAIAMAGSLASDALERGLSVGMCAFVGDNRGADETPGAGVDGWVKIPPNRGKRQRRELLTALAMLGINAGHDRAAPALLEAARDVSASSTTAVLFTPQELTTGIGDRAFAHASIIVTAGSQQAREWFTFDDTVDFATAMPVDQQPMAAKKRRGRRTLSEES